MRRPARFRARGHARPTVLAGMGRTRSRVLLGAALITVFLFAFSGVASARPHEFTAAFGSKCLLEPCTGEAVKRPVAVAVNEQSGDVYVLDEGEAGQFGRVVRFTAAGGSPAEFDGSGAHGEGSPAPEGRFKEPQSIAVDNSCSLRGLTEPQCKTEDPSNGDVYVLDSGHRVVDKYSATGVYLGEITEAGAAKFSEEGVEGVAVDGQGHLYVYREGAAVDAFTHGEPNLFQTVVPAPPRAGHPGVGFAAPGFAVAEGPVFYGRMNGAHGIDVVVWNEKGEVLREELGGGENSSVAVEQTTGNAVVDNVKSVGVFNPEGRELERLGSEHGEEHLIEGVGIAANAKANTIYAGEDAAASAHAVVVFGPAAATVPKVEGESFSEVTSTGTVLEAQVNPRSEPGEADTEYSFQYGVCAAVCSESGFEASAPVPDGRLAPAFKAQSSSATLTGLRPRTTYHFRVLVKNGHGAGALGGEVSFTTEATGGPLVLADDRGWELVSPPDKEGASIEPLAQSGVIQAAASGDGITYLANAPTEAQPAGFTNKMQILSGRGASSWSSRDIGIAHTGATGLAAGPGPEYKFFDPQLNLSAIQPFGEFIPQLSEEASESTAYLHALGDGCGTHCFRPLVTGKAPFANVPQGVHFGQEERCRPGGSETPEVACGPEFLDATPDLRHVVLTTEVPLASGAVPQELYEWSAGKLAPVSVLPGGTAVEGHLGLASQAARGAISNDGSRVVWAGAGGLYLRDSEREETLQLDKAESCAGCTSGGGQFQIASTDGSRVFFTDTNRLSEHAGTSGVDLYECQVVLTPKLACELSDLTPERGGESAEVQLGLPNRNGGILGAGEDGAQIYYVAKGIQSGANAEGNSPVKGQPNLYVHEAGASELIATLSSGDEHDWLEQLVGQPTRVSPNGQYLEFMSQATVRGYDNTAVGGTQPAAEVYLYDAGTKQLRCASCMPSGERPKAVEYHNLEAGSGGLAGGLVVWEPSALVAANVPGWTAIGEAGRLKERYQPRYLNNEGRLFFNSIDALVPQDANGTQDVYEYEPPGVGGCDTSTETFSARSGGCVNLISSGTSTQESAFLDASETGDDVFFLTSSRLSKLDTDNALDVYDAHVCSSASPCITYPGAPAPPCSSESSCKPAATPQPSILGAPASATFQGPPNPTPTRPITTPKRKTAEQLRIEKLGKALKACRKLKNQHRRHACEQAAHKRYPARKTAKKANHVSHGRDK